MIEHPLPQNITAYQFHLIGNMTVKQFLILLAGVGIGFLFYSTNLFIVIKWFFIIFFFLIAAAMAFVPYESRTLDQWIINFIKAIYRPTKFYWTRKIETPKFFSYVQRSDIRTQQSKLDLTPYRQQQVRQYLSSLGTLGAVAADPLDTYAARGAAISEMFTNVQAAQNVDPAEYQQVIKPQLQVRARPLRPNKTLFSTSSAAVPSLATIPVKTAPATPPAQHSTAVHAPGQTQALSHEDMGAAPVLPQRGDATVEQQNVLKVAPVVQQASPLETDNSEFSDLAAPSQGDSEMYATSQDGASSQSERSVIPAVFNNDLPFPSLPEKPNLLVGMVHDPAHKIVPGAIVEILDSLGNTVRAMKTNTLGQFYISSPLPNGAYTLETEKDGLSFPLYSFETSGTVLSPVDVQATPALTA